MNIRVGIGQDAHKFELTETGKKCIIGGLIFDGVPGLDADSDGDIVLHAICNAISSITHVPILGGIAIKMCREQGITDSSEYIKEALKTLGSWKISSIALSIEGKRPKFQNRSDEIRESVAKIVKVHTDCVGVTFVSGQELTTFGQGLGVQCFAAVTFNC